MAKVKLAKVQVAGLAKHYDILVNHLQNAGMMQITPSPSFEGDKDHASEALEARYDLARIDGALKFLAPYQTKKAKLDSFLSGGKLVMSESKMKEYIAHFEPKAETFLDDVFDCEESFVREKNELAKLPVIKKMAEQLKGFEGSIEDKFDTEMTRTWIGAVKKGVDKTLIKMLAAETNLVDVQRISKFEKEVFIRITAFSKYQPLIEGILDSVNFKMLDMSVVAEHHGKTVSELGHWYESEENRIKQNIVGLQAKTKDLAQEVDHLRVFYDHQLTHKHREDLQDNVYLSTNVFAFEGWMPKTEVKSLKNWMKKAFAGQVGLEEVEPSEEEVAPVLLKNKTGIRSFETIVSMFGLPGKQDFDPTAIVTPFFFVFFGLCLSDVGYGLILTLVALFFILFGKFSSGAKHSLALLLLCGIGATIGGVILGGYFGLEASQAPQWMVDPVTGMFKGQLFKPLEGAGPMTFLGISLALGAVHLLVGVFLEGVKKWMNGDKIGAFLDSWAWFFFLVCVLCFGLSGNLEVLDKELWTRLTMISAVILVFTQGRTHKNWLMKPIIGVLALYGATSYLSDLLSYARIMALGLATGVVGFAMNLTAGVVYDLVPVPWLGFVAALVVVVSGHGLNFALSLLGAFIHCGRLQFIEFFGKFYDAGGKPFMPFGKTFKYLFIKS